MSHLEEPHICACEGCRPELALTSVQLHEGHINVDMDMPFWRFGARLDGVDVTNDCVEAYGGDPGFVLVLRTPHHLCCSCADGLACTVRLTGRVEVFTPVWSWTP